MYEGEWINNVRKGKGKYLFNNGNTFSGNWSENKINGYESDQ